MNFTLNCGDLLKVDETLSTEIYALNCCTYLEKALLYRPASGT